MEFTKATDRDIPKIREIWRECFGDPEQYIDFFLQNRYNSDDCFVARDQGEPVAMLHAFDCRIRLDGTLHPCRYFYAVGTLRSHQRQGIAGMLTRFAIEWGQRQGTEHFCLLPASGTLYDFYRKLGFFEFFYHRRTSLPVEKSLPPTLSPLTGRKLMELRENRFGGADGFVSWGELACDYVIRERVETGGKAFLFSDGRQEMAALCFRDDEGIVQVTEFTGEDDRALVAAVRQFYPDANTMMVTAPASAAEKGERYGMLYTEKQPVPLDGQLSTLPYLNFTLS